MSSINGIIKAVSQKTGGLMLEGNEKWFNKDKASLVNGLPEKGDSIILHLNAGGFYTGYSITNGASKIKPIENLVEKYPLVNSDSRKAGEIRRMNALTNAIGFLELKKGTVVESGVTEEFVITLAKKFEAYIEKGDPK